MALLERVATLVRANLNDLIDKAEDPEKMIKQIILDMENQLLQVKTQVAISIADQHVLEKKQKENEESDQQWMRRSELAIDKGDDQLARAAIERALSCRGTAASFSQQVGDQKVQVDTLRQALLGGIAASRVLDVFGERMAAREFAPGMATRLYDKDLRIVLDLAREAGQQLPAGNLVRKHLDQMMARGEGNKDLAALIETLEHEQAPKT